MSDDDTDDVAAHQDPPAADPQSPEEAEEQELSLERLSAAFAQMLGGDADGSGHAQPGGSDDGEFQGDVDLDDADDGESAPAAEVSPKSILEALLFVGHPDNQPLTAAEVAELIRGVEPAEVEQLVDQLNLEYDETGAAYQIVSRDTGYLMVLKPAFYPVRERFYGRLREARLSQAALEVLSLVAYKQPLTVERINELRRTSSGSILNQLVRRQLLRMERPADDAKTRLYYTTPRFLQLFGLESLSDLPEAHDLDQM